MCFLLSFHCLEALSCMAHGYGAYWCVCSVTLIGSGAAVGESQGINFPSDLVQLLKYPLSPSGIIRS